MARETWPADVTISQFQSFFYHHSLLEVKSINFSNLKKVRVKKQQNNVVIKNNCFNETLPSLGKRQHPWCSTSYYYPLTLSPNFYTYVLLSYAIVVVLLRLDSNFWRVCSSIFCCWCCCVFPHFCLAIFSPPIFFFVCARVWRKL